MIAEDIETGFYSNLSNDKYHEGPGLSRSYLFRLIDRSPAHARVPVDETASMKIGTAFHTGILEPERFEREYIAYPADCLKGSGKGQEGRKAEFDEKCQSQGLIIMKPDEIEAVKRMRDAVYKHPEAKELLSNGESEISGYWKDFLHEDTLCKIRVDYLNKKHGILVDLKKCRDARPHAFRSASMSYGYAEEAGFYIWGCTQITGIIHDKFYFIAVEDYEPWGVMVYKATQEMIDYGRERCFRAIELHLECQRTGIWPCYTEDVEYVTVPAWAKNKLQGQSFDSSIYDL